MSGIPEQIKEQELRDVPVPVSVLFFFVRLESVPDERRFL